MDFTVRINEGTYDLEAYVRFIGQDLSVAIWGGKKPPIGAFALAQPRPSQKDQERMSPSAPVLSILGHKEDERAKAVSEILASTLFIQHSNQDEASHEILEIISSVVETTEMRGRTLVRVNSWASLSLEVTASFATITEYPRSVACTAPIWTTRFVVTPTRTSVSAP